MLRRLKALLFPSTLEEAELQGRGGRVAQSLVIAALILGGTAIALNFLRKSEKFDHWQARRATEKARVHLENGESEEAVGAFLQAWNNGSKHPDVIRDLAEMIGETSPPQAVDLYGQLESLGETLTPTDVRNYAIALAASGSLAEGKRRVAPVLQAEPDNPDNWRTAAHLAVYGRQTILADDYFSRLEEAGELQEKDRTKWLLVLAQDKNLSGHDEAIEELVDQALEGGERSEKASLLVLQNPPTGELLEKFLSGRLLQEDLPNSHRVALLKLEISKNPEKREAIFQREIEKHREVSPMKMVPFLNWLQEERESEAILSLLEGRDPAYLNHAVEHYCNALADLGRHYELSAFLKNSDNGLSASLLSVYRAAHDSQQGAPLERIREHLKSALASASNESKPEHAVVASFFAAQVGLPELAEDGMRDAVTLEEGTLLRRTRIVQMQSGAVHFADAVPTGTPQTYRAMLRLGQQLRNLRLEIDALKLLKAAEPANEHFPPRLCYLQLLVGEEIEASYLESIKELADHPQSPSWSLAAHLAYYRMGRSPRNLSMVSEEGLRFGEKIVLHALRGNQVLRGTNEEMKLLLPEEILLSSRLLDYK